MLRKSSLFHTQQQQTFYISSLRVLGSGSSSSTPTIRCLKNPNGPCPRCDDAMKNPLTSKNRRGNPSLLLTATSSATSTSTSSEKNNNNISDNQNGSSPQSSSSF